ncbi:MAG: NADH-quinone oxidoreductase subunit NuoF [Candidatus Wallbacteria bacterium]|nr:NADH-quinone oxidoreductase subunit NuoF [Candidatus Wallbacteria bacterium]
MPRLADAVALANHRRELKNAARHARAPVTVCCGTGCRAKGAMEVFAALSDKVGASPLGERHEIRQSGCRGFCERGPMVIVGNEELHYEGVTPKHATQIVQETLGNGTVLKPLLYRDPVAKQMVERDPDIPFYANQMRLVLRNCGRADPRSLDDYIAEGSYGALAKALTTMYPEEIIETIEKAGLRGRGGAGFPTGAKWQMCRKAPGKPKYIICNADEGDPGAFMDRSVLEGDPHSVIEGMVIGAYAIGASEGYIYVRAEYPLAVENFTRALEQAASYGLLGEDILGSGFSFAMRVQLIGSFRQSLSHWLGDDSFDFNLRVSLGGGAFVCGEETALMASIEGRAGEPRPKPPFPAQEGLWGLPTNINNVETWATVPLIIERGADWYRGIGTESSKGTKIFSLVGKVKNTGLVEVPMGTTLRKIIFEIGGGTLKDRPFKAVQTGGPSGGCIPAEHLDTPVDYEKLQALGSMMGSGGMIVMDERTCMVDVARYFVTFLEGESCGKCLPCREGTQRIREILSRITQGKGELADIEQLEELCPVIRQTSLCGLGQTAPNPVLSTLRYFRDEYMEHIVEKRCRSGTCKALVNFIVLPEKCTGCMACLKVCPADAIQGALKQAHVIDPNHCDRCGSCFDCCRFDAIIVQ